MLGQHRLGVTIVPKELHHIALPLNQIVKELTSICDNQEIFTETLGFWNFILQNRTSKLHKPISQIIQQIKIKMK